MNYYKAEKQIATGKFKKYFYTLDYPLSLVNGFCYTKY